MKFMILVRESEEDRWQDSGEGPWESQIDAIAYAEHEVGVDWIIVQRVRDIFTDLIPCRGCGTMGYTVYCQSCSDLESQYPCPHGQALGECNACDVEGDLAYDSAREG